MATIDILLLLALSAIWGSSFIFMSFLAPIIGPVATADMRMFFAGVVLALFFAITGFSAGWRKYTKHFLVIGLLNSAIPFLLYSVAALVLPPSMEAIFNSMSPMFGAVFAAIWLAERLTFRKIAGLLLGIAGVVAMSSLSNLPHSPTTVFAIIGCLFAPLCYGLAGVYIKRNASGVKPMAIAGGSQLFGGLALMPFLLVSAPQMAVISPRVALVTVAFAVLCSAVAYVIYYRLIADIGPTKALTVTFLIPIFAMLWQALILRETTTWSMLLGAAVILAGTYLVTAPQGRRAVAVSR
ncbi:MAG: DMT family transporter [Spirochaetia bacterium]